MVPSPDVLREKVALVTGVGPGIGRAVTERFAAAGAFVAFAARRPESVAVIEKQLRAKGYTVHGFAVDVSVEGAARDLARRVVDVLGPVQVLFNNAAKVPGQAHESVFEATDDDWLQSLNVNVRAPLWLAQELAPEMRATGYGSIINVLTTSAFSVVRTSGAPYSVTKAALFHLTKMLAAELAPSIRVNAICPGTIDIGQTVRPGWEDLIQRTPLARIGLPAEVAEAALFLASDASSYTTAQCLFVDGGRACT